MKRLNSFVLVLALIIIGLSLSFPQTVKAQTAQTSGTVYNKIDEKYFVTRQDMEQTLAEMGSDRSAYSAGEYNAAYYLASKFEEFGLGALDDKYIHSFGSGASESYNVVGRLIGKTSSKQIVIGAHYDNAYTLMNKTTNSQGVYDNLSGVMCVLKLAQAFADYQQISDLPCDIVFVCYGAEEVGMLGSKEFVKYCRLNNYNTMFAFNFDSIGCGEELYCYSGEVMTSFNGVLADVIQSLELPFKFSRLPSNKKLSFIGGYENSVYSNIGLQSDNLSYLNGNVSSTTFFSGNWKQGSQFVESSKYSDNIYHTENDNIEEFFERFPDCLDKINSVICVAYSCVESGQLANIESSMFNGFVFNNKLIIVAIGLFTMIVVAAAAGRSKNKKV